MGDAVDDFLKKAKHADGTPVASTVTDPAVEDFLSRHAPTAEKARTAGAASPAAQLSALREPDPGTIDYNALPATSPQQSTLGSPGAAGQGWHGITDVEAAQGERSYMGQMARQVASPFTTAGESIQQAKNAEGTVDPALTAGLNTAASIAFAPAAIATAPLAPALNWVGEELDPIARGAAWVAKGMPEGPKRLVHGDRADMPGEGSQGVQSVRSLVNLGSQYVAAKGAGAAIGALRGSPIGEAVKSEFKSVLPTYGREAPAPRPTGNPVLERSLAAAAEESRRIGKAVDAKYANATLKPQDVPVPDSAKAEMPKPPVPVVAAAVPAPPEKPAPTTVPDWLKQNAAQTAKTLGPDVLRKIEDLALQGKTAKEIAAELGIDARSVGEARNHLGIPSRSPPGLGGMGSTGESPEFIEWRDRTLASRAKPAPTPPSRAGEAIPAEELAALGDKAWEGVETPKPAEAPPSPPPARTETPTEPSVPNGIAMPVGETAGRAGTADVVLVKTARGWQAAVMPRDGGALHPIGEVTTWKQARANARTVAGRSMDTPPASEQAPAAPRKLYRQVSASEADSLVNPSTMADSPFGVRDTFVADSPDLALGQGANANGVMIEFSDIPDAKPSRVKPGADFVAQNGGGSEYVVRRQPSQLRDNVQAVTIPNTKGDAYTQRLRRALNGWDKTKNPDGSVTYRRPSPAAPSAPDVPAAPVAPDPSPAGDAAVPPSGPTIGAGVPPEPPPPSGATLGAESPKRPLTPGDNRGAIRTQLSEKIDNLKGFSPDLFYKVKEALSLKSARTAKPVRDLQQALKNLSPEEAQGLTPAIMERRAKGTPAQNAFVEWWHRTHPNLREHLKQVGSRVVETRDLADLPETIPPDWNLKEIGPGKYLVTRPINAVPDFFPMKMSETAREALKAGDPVVTEAIYGEGVKQGAWKDKAGFDQYLETYEAPNLKSTAAGLERPRKFKVPDEYREPDVVKTLNRYMHDVGQTSSEQSVFRYFDEKTGEARNPNETWSPQGDLGDILGRIDPTEKHAAERLALDLLGRDPEGWAAQNRKSIDFSNKVGAVNALRLYGLRPTTALVQLTQSAMTNSFVGTRATMKAIYRLATNPRAVYEEAVRSGAVRPHSQYADTIGVREHGAEGGGVLNAASDLAMKPMAMTDLAGRLIASATADDFAAQVQKGLRGSSWSKRIAMKKLEALDYAPTDAAQFLGKMTPEQMDILRQRIVERTQGEVTNASRIPAATTPVGRVLMQGKNFGVAQARNTWRVAGKQLFQAGNPIPAAKLVVGAYLAGKGIAAAKDALVGPSEKSRPDDVLTALHEGSLGGYVGDVAYSGIRGKMQLDETLNRISDSQFAGLLATIAKAGYDLNDPPSARKIRTGQGPPIDIKKSRADVLIAALQNAAPTGKEWVRIYDHFIGDDSIRKHEANAKALRELRKAQTGATLGAGAR